MYPTRVIVSQNGNVATRSQAEICTVSVNEGENVRGKYSFNSWPLQFVRD